MLGLAGKPEQKHSFRWHVLAVGVVLLVGVSVFAGVERVLAEPPIAAMLAGCLMLLLGILFVTTLRLRAMRIQCERVLRLAGESEMNISTLVQIQDKHLKDYVVQLFENLQHEVDELRAREQLLRVQAYHDGLTGLANRLLLADRFNVAVVRAKRNSKCFALLMIDLNDFKSVNDLYGHAAGDAVLIATARRLACSVRASDTVARLGGDEFVLIIESLEEQQEIAKLGEKLFDSLSAPIPLDTAVLESVSASIGVAVYPDDGLSLNEMLAVADQAMYDCKTTRSMSLL